MGSQQADGSWVVPLDKIHQALTINDAPHRDFRIEWEMPHAAIVTARRDDDLIRITISPVKRS